MLNIVGHSNIKQDAQHIEISVKGSATFKENVDTEKLEVIGHCKIYKNVKTVELRNKGVLSINGNLSAKDIINTGDMRVHSVEGHAMQTTGNFSALGVIKVEKLDGAGAVSISDKLITHECKLELKGVSKIKEISCENFISIKGKKVLGLSFLKSKLISHRLESKVINLNFVEVDLVIGEVVEVGPNCKISEIKYSKELKIDPKAEVLKVTKI